jgi:hypothetical protein
MVQIVVLLAMFSARRVALNVMTASVQLRMLRNSIYHLPRGQSYQQLINSTLNAVTTTRSHKLCNALLLNIIRPA